MLRPTVNEQSQLRQKMTSIDNLRKTIEAQVQLLAKKDYQKILPRNQTTS
jgi:hypothetical protein